MDGVLSGAQDVVGGGQAHSGPRPAVSCLRAVGQPEGVVTPRPLEVHGAVSVSRGAGSGLKATVAEVTRLVRRPGGEAQPGAAGWWFTPRHSQRTSGQDLLADSIVTATWLNLNVPDDLHFSVNRQALGIPRTRVRA